jgi:Fe-S cluster biogenesis protein NfuA/nitrite reductase/ring-hydroxylating ferredoxin subunit
MAALAAAGATWRTEATRMGRAADTGARIDELLAGLRSQAGGRAADAADELVRQLVGLYGDCLGQIVELLHAEGQQGERLLAKLAEDPLVESLLLVHDLHPLDADARIQRALDQVRPYLGSHAGGVEYLGSQDGVARLRLEGSCHGCPSSTATVQLAIEGAVRDAAPEISGVVVEGMTTPAQPQLLQIGTRPADVVPLLNPGAELAVSGANWVTLANIGPPSARPVRADADGTAVLVCAVRGTLYAYLDRCARCGASLAEGRLDRDRLTCPTCQAEFDVRLAGRNIDDAGLHLDPLPLLADGAGVRVSIPEAVRS